MVGVQWVGVQLETDGQLSVEGELPVEEAREVFDQHWENQLDVVVVTLTN